MDAQGYCAVEGGRLYYEVRGAGAPVVLLHSGLVDSRMWDAQMDAFAAKFRVFRYDLRGFGRSTPPTAPYSHVDDLDALFRHLRIDRAAAVGVSFGGRIAIDFTLEHPEKVRALVAVAAAASGYNDWSPELREAWSAMESAILGGDIPRAQKIEMDLWLPPGTFPESDAFIWKMAVENRKVFGVDPELERRLERPAFDRLPEIRAPTLVVLGERDLRDIEVIGEVLVQRIHGARKVVIPRTDHLVNVRNPEAFNRAVLEFLEGATSA